MTKSGRQVKTRANPYIRAIVSRRRLLIVEKIETLLLHYTHSSLDVFVARQSVDGQLCCIASKTRGGGFVSDARRVKKGKTMSFKEIAHKISGWRRYRHSVRELTRLSDRELADLGMARADIATVARKAAGL